MSMNEITTSITQYVDDVVAIERHSTGETSFNIISTSGQNTDRQSLYRKATFLSALIVYEQFPALSVEEKVEKVRERLSAAGITGVGVIYETLLTSIFTSSRQEAYHNAFFLM